MGKTSIDGCTFENCYKGIVCSAPIDISVTNSSFKGNSVDIELFVHDGHNVTLKNNQHINTKLAAINISDINQIVEKINRSVSASRTFSSKEKEKIIDEMGKFQEHRNLQYTIAKVANEIGKHVAIAEFIDYVKQAFALIFK